VLFAGFSQNFFIDKILTTKDTKNHKGIRGAFYICRRSKRSESVHELGPIVL
jgi:hypothetical protein